MATLYGLRACDTCRKAVKALDAAGRAVRFVDLRDTPVDAGVLRQWHETFGPSLLNTRSTTWRGLSDAERAGDPVALMQAHPALIKRPVIDMDGTLSLGWTQAVQAERGIA